ncbi:MAG: hypothetical protein H6825_11605 [Planctomycetes bacterium]|nr:hypothetical protein [Planctomycetota bacterium]
MSASVSVGRSSWVVLGLLLGALGACRGPEVRAEVIEVACEPPRPLVAGTHVRLTATLRYDVPTSRALGVQLFGVDVSSAATVPEGAGEVRRWVEFDVPDVDELLLAALVPVEDDEVRVVLPGDSVHLPVVHSTLTLLEARTEPETLVAGRPARVVVRADCRAVTPRTLLVLVDTELPDAEGHGQVSVLARELRTLDPGEGTLAFDVPCEVPAGARVVDLTLIWDTSERVEQGYGTVAGSAEFEVSAAP